MAADGGSWLLLEDLWAAGDRRALDELFRMGKGQDKKLKGFATKWLDDPRPFARTLLFAYIDDGCDRPFHRPLVKKLFKTSEERSDDAVMARFLVAFDRLARRTLEPTSRYDWATRTTVEGQELRQVPGIPGHKSYADREGRFTWATRHYLQRRVLRYFRTLGRTAGEGRERYRRAVQGALLRYQEEHLSTAAALLDARSLTQILFADSPVLVRTPGGTRLAPGAALRDLTPAPLYPDAWLGHTDDVLGLVLHAHSRTVRQAARVILERHHADALRAIPVTELASMLRSPHEEAQVLAIGLLEQAGGLETLPLDAWLALLSVESAEVLPRVTALVEKHVSPERVDLVHAVRLACAASAPIAELGLRWARTKPVRDVALLLPLAEAPAPSVRAAAVGWLTELLTTRADTTPEHLRDVLDARFADARGPALVVLDTQPRYRESTALWGALTESPHADVRDYLIRHLVEREKSLPAHSVERVWATTLLSIQRGSRSKPRVLAQVAERCVEKPTEARALLPLLRVGLRSARPPERKAALAVIAQAAFREPTLRVLFAAELPELQLGPEDSVCS